MTGSIQTNIVAIQNETSSEEIGFTVISPDGEVVYTKNPGLKFANEYVFSSFCPIAPCNL